MRLIDDKGESLLDTQNDAGDLRVNEYAAYSRRQLLANAAIAASCAGRITRGEKIIRAWGHLRKLVRNADQIR
jgi:hypothetical protein